LKMVVGLAIVLGLIYGIYRMLKRFSNRPGTVRDVSAMKVVATTQLSPARALHLLRVGDELVLVGSAEHGVTPIRVYSAVEPRRAHHINEHQAIVRGLEPLRTFMFKQTRDADLALFLKLAHARRPKTRADVATHVLIPAFVISELKTAFQIGFLIYLPFLIIDMVVAATLTSMGMMMLPPVLVSLPFKILLFVLVDGWHLVIESLMRSFNT